MYSEMGLPFYINGFSSQLIEELMQIQARPLTEGEEELFQKDDSSRESKHVYDVLWVLFVFLFILGLTNVWLLNKQAKFRKPIFAFYASSLCVVFFRCFLFMDQWVDYKVNIYVILLVSMPTYLYLIVGMSQVMLSVECIIKYKNFEI